MPPTVRSSLSRAPKLGLALSAAVAALHLSAPAAAQDAAPDADAEPSNDSASADDSTRDEQARHAFILGRDAHSAGDFETALQQFQASYAASGRPEILYNIATSLDRLGRFDEALEYFRRYLRERPDADNREFVESRMHVLEGLIDQRERREQEAEDARHAAADAQEPPSLIPPIAVAGAGVALGAISVGLLIRGHGQLDELEAQCEAGGCRDIDAAIEGSGVERTRRTVRALGISGVLLAAGGALWLVLQTRDDDDGDEPTERDAERNVELRPAIGFGTLHLTGRF